MKPKVEALVLGLGLLLYVGLAVTSLRQSAATYDEGAHLPAGYSYLLTGDHRLNPEHPPLVKLLAAAPLLLLRDVSFRIDDDAWAAGRQWELGRRFLYRWNDADRLLFWARLPMVALGACVCASVFLWARARFGFAAASLALLLAVLSPDLLAHGRLVTTDVAMALFYFLAAVSFDAALRRATWPRLGLAGLAAAFAFASKFSAPVLAPVLVAVAAFAVFSREPMTVAFGPTPRTLAPGWPRAKVAAALLLATFLMAWLGLWAAYGFARPLSPDPAVRAELLASTLRDDGLTPVARAALGAERFGLLPEAYVRGFLFTYRHAESRPTFLLGHLSLEGFPYFFLVTFALKTPLPLILLLFLSMAVAWRGTAFQGRPRARAARRGLLDPDPGAGLEHRAPTPAADLSLSLRRRGPARRSRLGCSPRPPAPSGRRPGAGRPGTRSAPCACTRTTWPISTRSPGDRRAATIASWIRASIGGKT